MLWWLDQDIVTFQNFLHSINQPSYHTQTDRTKISIAKSEPVDVQHQQLFVECQFLSFWSVVEDIITKVLNINFATDLSTYHQWAPGLDFLVPIKWQGLLYLCYIVRDMSGHEKQYLVQDRHTWCQLLCHIFLEAGKTEIVTSGLHFSPHNCSKTGGTF